MGAPPRLTPLDREATADEARASWKVLRKAVSGRDDLPPGIDDIPAIYFTMLRCPGIWEQISMMSVQLQSRGQLPPRERELVILRTGWLWQAPFEWGEHVALARREALLNEDEIERITQGSDAPGWSEHERALLRAAEELCEGAMVSDATWETLAQTLSQEQLLELVVLAGHFTTVAYWQNALRIPLNKGNEGLAAR